MSPTRATGRKTAIVVAVAAVMAPATSLTPDEDRLRLLLAEREVPLDVLDDDDRVVDDAADGDRDRAEREDVEGVPRHPACR
jgi:hypothetical protein